MRRDSAKPGSAFGSGGSARRAAETVVWVGVLGTLVALVLLRGTAPTADGGLEVGAPAPPVSLTDVRGGDPWSLEGSAGRATALLFWAPWCGVCVREMPTWVRLAAEFAPKGLDVVSISSDPAPSLLAHLRGPPAGRDLPFPVLHDARGQVSRAYGVRALPRLVIVGPRGEVARAVTGAADADTLRGWLQSALPR